MSYIQKFRDSQNTQNVGRHMKMTFNKKLVLVFLITLAIPLTVVLSSKQQTSINHAAPSSAPTSEGYIVIFKDPPLADSTQPNSTNLQLSRPPEDRRLNIEAQHKIIKVNILSILGASAFTSDTNPASGEVEILGEYENILNGVALDISSAQAEKLKTSPYVKAVYPNLVVHTMLMNSVPLINADKVWNVKDSTGAKVTGKNVNIAIMDTGVDYTHPDLGGSVPGQIFNSKVTGGYDFVNNDSDPMDDHGHGTHVAEIAAGNGVLKGVAPGANIIAYKVLDANGSGNYATIMLGIDAAVGTHFDADPANDVSIMSFSLGLRCASYSSDCGPDDILSQKIDAASSEGIVSIVAAGNSGSNVGTITSPGTARSAITVGSISKSKVISAFSSRGPVTLSTGEIINKPDVLAPGESICSAKASSLNMPAPSPSPCVDGSHIYLSGTSMATPHVAGFAALIKQEHPQYNSSDIKYMITQNATNLGYDANTQGHGMIDAANVFTFPPPGPSITPVPTVTPIPTKYITVTAYQDSFVAGDQSNANYGGISKIKIDGSPREYAYLKFDLTPLAGKNILSAKLVLKVPTADGSGSSNTFNIKKVVDDWSEGGVKFSNKPSQGTQIIASFTGKGTGNTIQSDVKSGVISGLGSKVSWGISTDGGNELILYSKDASSNRPHLDIQYQ